MSDVFSGKLLKHFISVRGEPYTSPDHSSYYREDLRDQHAVGEEIAEVLKQGTTLSGLDEDDLETELAELQQEELDSKMLKTGSVPVSDEVTRLPSVATGERKCFISFLSLSFYFSRFFHLKARN